MRELSALRQAMKENAVTSKDYFGLADDGDRATVVFLHSSEADIDWGKVYECHLPIEGEFNADGTQKKIKKYVLWKSDTDPLSKAGMKTRIRALFQLVERGQDGTYGEVKVWDRGPNHIDQILTFMETLGPLNTYPITIVRNGKKGSNQTKYQMIPGRDVVDPNTLPKPENLTKTGRYILDLSLPEMEAVANETYFLPAFEKIEEAKTVSVNKGNTFKQGTVTPQPEIQQEVQQEQQNTPPKPVFNKATGQWELPQPKVLEEAPRPPEPVFNHDTGQWEIPQAENQQVGIITNGKKVDNTKMF